jgi:hypothetical protein
MRQNDITEPQGQVTFSHTLPAKLCIVWEDGRRARFPYQFLTWEEYLPNDEYLLLECLSYRIKLKGINLPGLFDYLAREPSHLYVTPARYVSVAKDQPFIVTEAVIENGASENKTK